MVDIIFTLSANIFAVSCIFSSKLLSCSAWNEFIKTGGITEEDEEEEEEEEGEDSKRGRTGTNISLSLIELKSKPWFSCCGNTSYLK